MESLFNVFYQLFAKSPNFARYTAPIWWLMETATRNSRDLDRQYNAVVYLCTMVSTLPHAQIEKHVARLWPVIVEGITAAESHLRQAASFIIGLLALTSADYKVFLDWRPGSLWEGKLAP